MPDIRLHGRGGQGILAAGEIIARAAWYEGWQSHFFPFFGSERSGSPVAAFVRLRKQEILTREQVSAPDILVVQYESLLREPDTMAGVSTKTKVAINSEKEQKHFQNIFRQQNIKLTNRQFHLFDADNLAAQAGLARSANVVLAAWTGRNLLGLSYDAIKRAIEETFRDKDKAIIASNVRLAKTIFTL